MNNARLERATAAGNVRASWKTGQIAAGMLDYDDVTGKITAGAEEPSYVTALDTATGRITEAQSLEYDLRTGKIRVIRLRASGGR